MLRDGLGITQNKPMALKYFRQAAEANYADASLLAQLLVDEGVKMPEKSKVKRSVASVSTKSEAKKSAKSGRHGKSAKSKKHHKKSHKR